MTAFARFPVSQQQIGTVVARFYALVRADDVLGPVFAVHVADWPAHEEKIACFWSNAILGTRNYDGNPMQAHLAAGNVIPEHFERWLGLFDRVLRQELPADVARAWSYLAHRVGRGLSMGLEYDLNQKSGPPRL